MEELYGFLAHRIHYSLLEAALRIWNMKTGMCVRIVDSVHNASGLAFLADGALYVNTFREGGLYRVGINPDGSAGTPQRLALSQPLERPDAMRTIGPDTLLVAEGVGKVSIVTIRGDQATVRVVRDGMTDGVAAAVLVGDVAYAVQPKFAKMSDPAVDPGAFAVVAVPLR